MGEQLSVLTEENDEDKGRPEMSGRPLHLQLPFRPAARGKFRFSGKSNNWPIEIGNAITFRGQTCPN
jgi:hypothetical protein